MWQSPNEYREISFTSQQGGRRAFRFQQSCLGGGGVVYLFSTFFPKSESERELFKAKRFFLYRCPESRQISPEEIRYFFLLFFFISFCSISSIWRLLVLVSPSNMWKMYSTMQSRWLGHHLLSHRSFLCIPEDAFQNQRTILLGATERGNEKKKWTYLCSHTDTFVACPPLATCLALGIPRNPRPGLNAWRRSKRVWEAMRLWQTGLAFCSVLQQNGHLEVRSVAERKGEDVSEDLAPWGDVSCHHLLCTRNAFIS